MMEWTGLDASNLARLKSSKASNRGIDYSNIGTSILARRVVKQLVLADT